MDPYPVYEYQIAQNQHFWVLDLIPMLFSVQEMFVYSTGCWIAKYYLCWILDMGSVVYIMPIHSVWSFPSSKKWFSNLSGSYPKGTAKWLDT